MAKTQILEKQKKSLKNTSVIDAKPRLKSTAKASDYSAASELRNRKFISEAIADALIDGDAEAVREIMASHLEQVHKDHFFKEAGVSRRALYALMKPRANPTLESLAKVCKALSKVA